MGSQCASVALIAHRTKATVKVVPTLNFCLAKGVSVVGVISTASTASDTSVTRPASPIPAPWWHGALQSMGALDHAEDGRQVDTVR